MGYRLNRLDEPVFMAVPEPMLTEFGIYYRLESCVLLRDRCNLLQFLCKPTWIAQIPLSVSEHILSDRNWKKQTEEIRIHTFKRDLKSVCSIVLCLSKGFLLDNFIKIKKIKICENRSFLHVL